MKKIKVFVYRLLVLSILLAGGTFVFILNAPAQDMFVLMVIDTDDPMGFKRCEVDKHRIENFIKSKVAPMLEKEKPGTMVKISALLSDHGHEITRENIFGWLQGLTLEPDDVVFVYFSGEGGADKEGIKGRFLRIRHREKLYRKELATVMEALNCRLKILITETSSVGPIPMVVTDSKRSTGTEIIAEVGKTADTIPKIIAEVGKTADTIPHITPINYLRQLFLEHEGFLNLTSTSLGHAALGRDTEGSWFTKALIEEILRLDSDEEIWRLHSDEDGEIWRLHSVLLKNNFLSWKTVFELTSVSLDQFYKEQEQSFPAHLKTDLRKLNQTTQIPEVLSDFPKIKRKF